jgi:hypothetical protein
MLGRETLFLSHLTMYGMEEHNFQIVLSYASTRCDATICWKPRYAPGQYVFSR